MSTVIQDGAAPEAKRKGTSVIRQQAQKYAVPTTLGGAAVAVVIWLGIVFVKPVAESQMEINKASAEASKASVEFMRSSSVIMTEFAVVSRRLSSTMDRLDQVLERSVKLQELHSEQEAEHFAQTQRAVKSILELQEDLIKKLREDSAKDGGT